MALHRVTLNGTGQATWTTTTLPVGTESLTAEYAGDAYSSASTSGAIKVTVMPPVATTTMLVAKPSTASVGKPLTFTVTVQPTSGVIAPRGRVTLKEGTVTLGSASLGVTGRASLAVSTLAIGAHSITASYAGDASAKPSISVPVVVTIQ